MVGAGSNSVRDAGKVLQNVIQERSLKLTYENTLVRESHQWKTFLSNLTSSLLEGQTMITSAGALPRDKVILACEQALLFGQEKRASRERVLARLVHSPK